MFGPDYDEGYADGKKKMDEWWNKIKNSWRKKQ